LPDRELAVTLNRMGCKPSDGNAWTRVRVRELRERLGIAPVDPSEPRAEVISADAAAIRLGICVGSVHELIREGVLPATQLMPSAPWQIPAAALDRFLEAWSDEAPSLAPAENTVSCTIKASCSRSALCARTD
jgi:hypothetical protein